MKEKYNQAVNFLKNGKLDKAKVLCLEILEEISLSATCLDDMRNETATEIYSTCILMKRKAAKIIEAKSMQDVDFESITELL